MTKEDLVKSYYSGMGDTTPDIVIKYNSNQKEYTLYIKAGINIVSDNEKWDSNLTRLLDLDVDRTETKLDSDNYVTYSYDWNAKNHLNII